jgi:hypothetical protein
MLLIQDFRKTRDYESLIPVLKQDEELFNKVVLLSLSSMDYPYPEYSSWLLSNYAKKFPNDFDSYVIQLVDCLEKSKNQTVLRNLLAILRFVKISDEDVVSRLLDLAISFITDNSNKVALQVYAIQILIPIVKLYPELKDELRALLDLNCKDKSPAFQVARKNFFKVIKVQ